MNKHSGVFAVQGLRLKFEQALRITKVLSVVLAAVGMSVLSTDNAFSQTQGVALTGQTPAGPNRPAGVPENYVITPNGYFHPSCVIGVKETDTVRVDGHIQHADGSIQNVPACGYPHYTGRGELATGAIAHGAAVTDTTTSPSISHSWIEAESVTTGGSFAELTASWVVPPPPSSSDGQTLYFFPGMEDSNNVVSIIQPVLGWTAGSGWTISSWNCCVSGTTYVSNTLTVNAGDVIRGTVQSTCGAGVLACATWNITTEDETRGTSTTLSNSSSAGQTFNWAFAGALEVYNVAQCGDYPPDGTLYFSNLALYDYNFNPVTPGWSFTNWASSATPQCGYGAAVVSPTQVALDYSARISPPADVSSDGVACPGDIVTWSAVPGATSYQLWDTTPGYGTYSWQWTGTTTSTRVILQKGTSKIFRVEACNANGCSPLSSAFTEITWVSAC